MTDYGRPCPRCGHPIRVHSGVPGIGCMGVTGGAVCDCPGRPTKRPGNPE